MPQGMSAATGHGWSSGAVQWPAPLALAVVPSVMQWCNAKTKKAFITVRQRIQQTKNVL